MLKKIISYLRDHNARAERRRELRDMKLAVEATNNIMGAMERLKEAEAMPHGFREQKIREFVNALYKSEVSPKDVPTVAAQLETLIGVHIDQMQQASFRAWQERREAEEQIRNQYENDRMAAEMDRVVHHFTAAHKRILLENQTLFSKEEWLARAAEGKRYPHDEDVFLGVPEDVLDEAKADFERVKHERDEIVRYNGPYMITVTEEGVTVLKDVLAGVGGIDDRATFEPITASQRKYEAALQEQQRRSADVVAFPVAK